LAIACVRLRENHLSADDVMPLQAQAFGYTESCAGGQKRQSAFRLSEVTHDCIRLFGGENGAWFKASLDDLPILSVHCKFFISR
jgi:hypothetical protein